MRLISVTTKKIDCCSGKALCGGKAGEKLQILDQFVSISGMQLRGADKQPQSRTRAQIYDEATRTIFDGFLGSVRPYLCQAIAGLAADSDLIDGTRIIMLSPKRAKHGNAAPPHGYYRPLSQT